MMDLPVPPSPENRPACFSGTRFRIDHSRSGTGSSSHLDMSIQRNGGSGAAGAVAVAGAAVAASGGGGGGHRGAAKPTATSLPGLPGTAFDPAPAATLFGRPRHPATPT